MDVWLRADCPFANFCTKRYDSRGILGCAASSGGSVSFSFLMMVRFTAVALALAASSAYALYHDEVGLNDFLISTGGHGRVTRSFFSSNGEIVLSGSPNHSCYVSARDVLTGALLWRMNGCSDGGRSSSSAVQSISLSNDGQVLVLHDGKILKGIDVVSGNLVIDEPYASAKSIEVMSDVKVPLSKIANGSKKGACKGTDSHFAVAISAPAKSDIVEVQVFQVKGDNFDLIKTDSLTSSILHKAVNGDIVDVFPSCGRAEMGSIEVLVTTSAGTSTMIQIPIMNQKLSSISKLWSHEEALATIISAVLLDNSPHVPVDEMVDVSFQDRLGLQLEGGKQFLSKILSRSGILDVVSDESDTFGFKKIAVALSQSTTSRSRLFGIDTLENGKIAWSLLLSEKSTKNVMFKDSISPSTSHHSSEVLLISELNDGKTLEWSCVDGINGNILDKGSLKVSNFSKFFPIDTTSKAKHCRQVVLALDESGNASVIPTHDDALDAAASVVELNNFYLHSIDRESGIISSLLIEESQSNEDAKFMSSVVGKARISEKIVSVAYPLPDEVVQSPATIMGDDSLLLKYLNPHIAVIVSQGYQSDIETFESNPDDFAAAEIALKAAKKPQGVSQPGESSPVVAQSPPSLFITLVDTVSAKILYRVSHADASGHPDIGINEVPVVVSENWIVYTFWNHRTKRSEIGVLTLYEGMVVMFSFNMFIYIFHLMFVY